MTAPAHWAASRDAIMVDLLDKGWNGSTGAYTMSYGADDLDAAVLRLPLMQVIMADDPRMRATSDAIDRELGLEGDLYDRYHRDDGLPGREGAFAACTYWAVANRVLTGRLDEARTLLDRGLARANDLGLFPEEFDVKTGAALGNFPQAFTHMAVIQETLRLSAALDAAQAL
jgi:GH15 family glucan-1,4-alpha-glucosidase